MEPYIDPVCDVPVEKLTAAGMSEHRGTTYYFHSEECLSKFNQNPERYVQRLDEGRAGPASAITTGRN